MSWRLASYVAMGSFMLICYEDLFQRFDLKMVVPQDFYDQDPNKWTVSFFFSLFSEHLYYFIMIIQAS